MTVASEISRLQNAKSSMKQAIINKGVSVADTDKLDVYADKINQIKTAGGLIPNVGSVIYQYDFHFNKNSFTSETLTNQNISYSFSSNEKFFFSSTIPSYNSSTGLYTASGSGTTINYYNYYDYFGSSSTSKNNNYRYFIIADSSKKTSHYCYRQIDYQSGATLVGGSTASTATGIRIANVTRYGNDTATPNSGNYFYTMYSPTTSIAKTINVTSRVDFPTTVNDYKLVSNLYEKSDGSFEDLVVKYIGSKIT